MHEPHSFHPEVRPVVIENQLGKTEDKPYTGAAQASFEGLIDLVEKTARHGVQSATKVTVEAIGGMEKVADALEQVGLDVLRTWIRMDNFVLTEVTKSMQNTALEVTRGSVEVMTEVVSGTSTVAKHALNELQEIAELGGEVGKSLLRAFWPTPLNPFRGKGTGKDKEPTIIPISIQDN